ncbi:MAG: 1-(5-phosphoribosyl)-5-[(5-phosphoribosylamino)methylideneamino]imidazole-4-carboxamide isomerase [Rudaea sp.]
MSFTVIPAIDLRGGRVVRLRQGDFSQQTTYEHNPSALAVEYATAGVQWLHVVDLDGARSGSMENLSCICAMAKCGLRIQAGGGVRGEDSLQRLFDAGVERVVVGSLAVRDPDCVIGWLRRYGTQRLTIGLDARFRHGAWHLASAGWTEDADSLLDVLASRFCAADALHLLCTDIDRDGMLSGPNIRLYKHLHEMVPNVSIQASGGVRDLADIRAARDSGASAVILGRALLERRFSVEEALAC